MAKVALIIGVSGMDGESAAHFLLSKGYTVVGTYRKNTQLNLEELAAKYQGRLELDYCEITDFGSVRSLLERTLTRYGHIDELYLLAAQSHVGFSFIYKGQTVLTNGMAVYNFLENLSSLSPKTSTYFAACYDEKTRVVTKNGVVPYTSLGVGDKVWSLNPENSQMEEVAIKRIFEYDYDGKMLHFKGLGKDFMVTPNHKVFYQRGKNKLLSAEAQEVNKLADVKLPRAHWDSGGILDASVDLTPYIPSGAKDGQIKNIDSLDLCYLLGLHIGDGSCNIMQGCYRSRFSHKDSISKRRDPKTGRMLPYSSQDSISTPVEKIGKTARITIDIPPEDDSYERFTKTLDRNEIKWTIHAGIDVTFFSWGLYYFFDKCGHTSWTKIIPREFLDLKRPYLEKILDGVVDSDGSVRNGRQSVSTTSLPLVYNLLELGTKLGYNVYYSKHKPAKTPPKINGREIIARRDSYIVYFNKTIPHLRNGVKTKWFSSSSATGKEVDYKGKIWCFELEKNHNFLVERNGHIVFSGNTSELMGGEPSRCPFDESSEYECRSPYSIGKELGTRWVKYYAQTHGMFATYGILFNHSNCTRGKSFFIRKLTNIAARIALGKEKEAVFGNLQFARDEHWSDFGVEMMWKMLQREKPETYLICRGKATTGEEFLDAAFGYFNLRWQDYVKFDVNLLRPNEVVKLVGNPQKAIDDLGWRPDRMSIEQHIGLMCRYDYDLEGGGKPERPDVFKLFP